MNSETRFERLAVGGDLSHYRSFLTPYNQQYEHGILCYCEVKMTQAIQCGVEKSYKATCL